MRFDLADAMRSATRLTRRRDLSEATRVIQDALSGKAVAPPSSDKMPPGENPTGNRHFGSIADFLRLDQSAAVIDGSAIPSANESSLHGRHRTRPLPLGTVVRTLRHARLRGFGLRNESGESNRPTPHVPEGAQFVTGSFTCAAGSRAFKLYVPRTAAADRRPLLVMLHGCTQDPNDFAVGTGMNAVAEKHGLLVAYPAQSKASNPSSCWNWFNPKDQVRGRGEPSIIAGITRQIVADYDVDPERIFVAGLSAGGAMAAVMGRTYPDLYRAIGVHSGLPYGSASDVVSAFAAMRGDSDTPVGRGSENQGSESTLRVRTIVFHGEADQTVHPSNAEKLIAQFRRLGDEDDSAWVPGELGARPARRTVIRNRHGENVAELWKIPGSSHAWSGGSADGSYTDPHGPPASREMVRFFLERPAP